MYYFLLYNKNFQNILIWFKIFFTLNVKFNEKGFKKTKLNGIYYKLINLTLKMKISQTLVIGALLGLYSNFEVQAIAFRQSESEELLETIDMDLEKTHHKHGKHHKGRKHHHHSHEAV